MKRIALVLLAVACALAAVSRDAYHNAYRAWRQADPNLERDAGGAGPAFGASVDRVAKEGRNFATARNAYLTESAGEEEQRLAWLEQSSAAGPEMRPGAAQVVTTETAAVRHSLDVYGTDPDPGIQQARKMLDRERAALEELASVFADEQRAAEAARSAAAAAEDARAKALPPYHEMVTAIKQAVEEASQESSAWADYYRKLSDDVREVSRSLPENVTVPPEQRRPVSMTTLALARYTGAWAYPASNGLSHGAEPEFADMAVHEQNGHIEGTLFVRFKVPSGDPELRFDFSGELKPTARVQVFSLKTSDGAAGTIELIPGSAFNLLEINFHTDAGPGKIHQGNFVLMKK